MSCRPSVSCSCDLSPNCCALVRVPVTHRDLGRLAKACTRSFASFIEWLGPSQIDMEGEPETFVELDVGRRLMVLRHANGACHLLSEGRCSEYSARPSPCAAYPFAFVTVNDHRSGPERPVVEQAAIASAPDNAVRRQLTVLLDAPCGSHQPNLAGVARESAVDEAVACVEAELNEYVRIVESWNRQQRRRRFAGHRARTAQQYLDFLEQLV